MKAAPNPSQLRIWWTYLSEAVNLAHNEEWRITDHIRKDRDSGFTLWSPRDNTMAPFAALTLAHFNGWESVRYNPKMDEINPVSGFRAYSLMRYGPEQVLGWDDYDREAFMAGYDGEPEFNPPRGPRECFELGRKLRLYVDAYQLLTDAEKVVKEISANTPKPLDVEARTS